MEKRNLFDFAGERRVSCFWGEMSTFTIPKDEAADLDNEEDWIIAEAILKARSIREKVSSI